MSSCVISKLESNVSDKDSIAALNSPVGDTAVAVPLTSLIANPGRLSIIYSPGKSKMVVYSVISLLLTLKYENLADSKRALWTVLKGLVNELPKFEILSVASKSLGFT